MASAMLGAMYDFNRMTYFFPGRKRGPALPTADVSQAT
jgi:hypothetical protein